MRWSIVLGVVVVAVAACSGSDPNVAVTPTSPPTADEAPPTSIGDDVVVDDTADDAATAASPDVVASVRIDVDVAGATAELTGVLEDSADPFGQFVSCSGLRESFGSYSVLASTPVGDVRSVSVVSTDLVPEPGVHDAAVRVEYANAPAVDAAGTMTIADDWRSGTYVAFDQAGVEVTGSFDCPTDVTAAPLSIDPDASSLEAVEVFALIRSGEWQRIIGLAAVADGTATIECPGAADGSDDSDLVVRVVGDESTGAMSEFELTAGAAPAVRMTVGSVEYEFERVERGGSDLPAAGTFGAQSDAVEVDGAFRCS